MNYQEFIQKYRLSPNGQQEIAIKSVSGHILLLAVPGSGKTTTLISRLGYMIFCENISPKKILSITFSNEASKDMAKRFLSVFNTDKDLVFRTINSLSLGLITFYSKLHEGYKVNNLIEQSVKKKILSSLYYNIHKIYPLETEINSVESAISMKKNQMILDEELNDFSKKFDFNFKEIYKGYSEFLKQNSLMDFDDQMVIAYNLLKSDNEFLQICQNQYEYISVDEAQDTSKIQYEIIKLISNKYQNLFMVGDEDQSIYGFRGATPKILLDFEKDFENAKVIYSEQNYRSGKEICDASLNFISKNKNRKDKKIISTQNFTSKINNIELKHDFLQYQYLLDVAKKNPKNTAILYRDNDSVIPLVDLLLRNGIPFKINKKQSSYTNRIMQDFIDILEFVFHPYSTEAFMKVYYKIGCKIDRKYAEKVCQCSTKNNKPVLQTASFLLGNNNPKLSNELKNVCKEFLGLSAYSGSAVYTRILNYCGYKNYLIYSNKLDEYKLRTIEFLSYNCKNASELLYLLKNIDAKLQVNEEMDEDGLILSTMHASKGREFDEVYLMDIIDGKCPTVDTGSPDYEEERRIFYVAMTRAKKVLNIFTFANTSSREKSSFSKEIFENPTKKQELVPEKKKSNINVEKISVGTQIMHLNYGLGEVLKKEEKNGLTVLSVRFKTGDKILSLNALIEKGLIELK